MILFCLYINHILEKEYFKREVLKDEMFLMLLFSHFKHHVYILKGYFEYLYAYFILKLFEIMILKLFHSYQF